MPITGTGDALGDAITDAIEATSFDAPARNAGETDEAYRARLQSLVDDNRQAAMRAVAGAIVDHLTADAVITGLCPPGTAGGPLQQGRLT